MSIVRYVNKKTGVVTLYESTSNYDPETKQSRPIRKYLGVEDPVTKELIPSSGKRGRKKLVSESKGTSNNSTTKEEEKIKHLYEGLKKECAEKKLYIEKLEQENKALYAELQRIRDIAAARLNSKVLQ